MTSGLTIFTLVHVVISLAGILSGPVVLFGLIGGKRLDGWTAFFLATAVATSVTGFFFPVHHFMPSHAIGILSLLVLGVAIYARYARHLAGPWRKFYVIGAVVSLYFNVFVGIVQAFQKIPALKATAPKQTDAPFLITQLAVLILFLTLGIVAALKFRDVPVRSAQSLQSRANQSPLATPD